MVADGEFIKHIKSRGVTGDLVMRDCATYQGKVPPKISNVLVFCRKGELGLVRHLKAKYPEKTIVSGTYEFSMLRADNMPEVANVETPGRERSSSPLVMLSAPYGKADFLNQQLRDATGVRFDEHLGRPMLDWLKLVDTFQASRFFANAEGVAPADKPFATQVQTDLLDGLLSHTNLTQERVARALNARQAKVLMLRHPARFDHAFASELLERSRLRFAAQAPAGKPHPVNPQKVTMLATLRWSKALLRQEAILDALADKLDNVLTVDAEDLMQKPEQTVGQAAEFLGLPIVRGYSVQSYTDYARPLKGLDTFTLPMKRQLIDRFGLHAS